MTFVANWKSAQTLAGAEDFLRLAKGDSSRGVSLAVCPPAPLLSLAGWREAGVVLGAQDVSSFAEGVHTGETPASLLKQLGVVVCLVNHSERRQLGERGEMSRRKLENLLKEGISPLICVGDRQQLEYFLPYAPRATFCWEPSANISINGVFHSLDVPALSRDLAEARKVLGEEGKLLYGGSVNGENVRQLARIPFVDGFLVGRASLDYAQLADLWQAIA